MSKRISRRNGALWGEILLENLAWHLPVARILQALAQPLDSKALCSVRVGLPILILHTYPRVGQVVDIRFGRAGPCIFISVVALPSAAHLTQQP